MKILNELKDNKKIINVFNLAFKKNKKNEESKDIICPECNNLAIINNNNDKITINCLTNNHKFIDLKINWFNESQYIDESSINCDKCGNNKIFFDKFYICSDNTFICPLCKNNNSKCIDLEERYMKCINHNINFISYCYSCKINLCEKCEEDHRMHEIRYYKQIKPNEKRIRELKDEEIKINKYKEEIKILNEELKDLTSNLICELDIINKTYQNIINNSRYFSNYESIKNILDFKCKELIQEIDNYFLNGKDKLKKIRDLYENKNNEMNEMNLIYKLNENENIKLFGAKFVENNQKYCYLLINFFLLFNSYESISKMLIIKRLRFAKIIQ
jgi:hypothetical protein